MSIPQSCVPAIEPAADALEAWWQPDPGAFRLQEVSHAFATHEIDSRRTATSPARMVRNLTYLAYLFSRWKIGSAQEASVPETGRKWLSTSEFDSAKLKWKFLLSFDRVQRLVPLVLGGIIARLCLAKHPVVEAGMR